MSKFITAQLFSIHAITFYIHSSASKVENFLATKLIQLLMREKQTDSWLHNYADIDKKERLWNIIINQLSHIMPVDNNPAKCICNPLRERWSILN